MEGVYKTIYKYQARKFEGLINLFGGEWECSTYLDEMTMEPVRWEYNYKVQKKYWREVLDRLCSI